MRLFVGLAVGETAKEMLERLTLRLRAKDDGLRWSAPEQWHVTLVFLGDVDDVARAALVRELKGVREPVLALHMDRLGVFERPGILHAEVEATQDLLRFFEAVAAAVKRCGLEIEERPYRAHITLARARNREGRKTIEQLRRVAERHRLRASWRAEEFLLYESRPSPGGSKYVALERFALARE